MLINKTRKLSLEIAKEFLWFGKNFNYKKHLLLEKNGILAEISEADYLSEKLRTLKIKFFTVNFQSSTLAASSQVSLTLKIC